MEAKVVNDWRLRGQRYRLEGEVCDHCGVAIFPPRDICPACNKPAKTPAPLSGRGEVYTFSTIYSAPEGFEPYTPYTVALVKLEEGPSSRPSSPTSRPTMSGSRMPVEMVTRRLRTHGEDGTIVYGYKFRPSVRM